MARPAEKSEGATSAERGSGNVSGSKANSNPNNVTAMVANASQRRVLITTLRASIANASVRHRLL